MKFILSIVLIASLAINVIQSITYSNKITIIEVNSPHSKYGDSLVSKVFFSNLETSYKNILKETGTEDTSDYMVYLIRSEYGYKVMFITENGVASNLEAEGLFLKLIYEESIKHQSSSFTPLDEITPNK